MRIRLSNFFPFFSLQRWHSFRERGGFYLFSPPFFGAFGCLFVYLYSGLGLFSSKWFISDRCALFVCMGGCVYIFYVPTPFFCYVRLFFMALAELNEILSFEKCLVLLFPFEFPPFFFVILFIFSIYSLQKHRVHSYQIMLSEMHHHC